MPNHLKSILEYKCYGPDKSRLMDKHTYTEVILDQLSLGHRTPAPQKSLLNFFDDYPQIHQEHSMHMANLGCSCFLLLTTQSRLLTTLKKKPFENIVGKGKKCW